MGRKKSTLVDAISHRPNASAGGGWHLFILWTFKEGWIVGGVHLQGGLRGDGGGTAATSRPRVRMEKLARVIWAVAEARPVEALIGPVHFLCCVSLHEQVHWHDTCRLEDIRDNKWESGSDRVSYVLHYQLKLYDTVDTINSFFFKWWLENTDY